MIKCLSIIIAVLSLGLLSGCDDAQNTNDAPAVPSPVTGPAEVLAMPDGFSNVATKCDGHGHRIYTVYRTWATGAYPAYGAVAVIDDAKCPNDGG